MTRQPRPVFADVPLHIIQRGNNRNPCFFSRHDYQVYRDFMADSSKAKGCEVHAYVLMPNHIHMLVSPTTEDAAAQMMKLVGQRYVQYINRKYKRTGTLWQGRFRSCLVENESYFMICQRYIELNPVRANIVEQPGDYEWSSYNVNAHGSPSSFIAPHSTYLRLADEETERQASYRELFLDEISQSLIEQVRVATNGNHFFGSERFSDELVMALGGDDKRTRAVRRLREQQVLQK